MEKIMEIRESILKAAYGIKEKKEVLGDLNIILKNVRELEYDNCSVEMFEFLVDEELILDLLINKGKLDEETAEELIENKDAYLKGEHTFKKLIDDILG